MGSIPTTARHPRRDFLARGARLAVGAATLSLLEAGFESAVGPAVARAHNVSGNAARASELYTAMQTSFYLGPSNGSLYNETSPRARSNPYAFLWPFYEATAGTIDLFGLGAGFQAVVNQAAVDDRLRGLKAYWNAGKGGYDSYPRAPYGNGGDRFNDDNAWVGRALVQLIRMGYSTAPVDTATTPLSRAKDLFTFLNTGWDTTSLPSPGGMYWAQQPSVIANGKDRGTGPTGGMAKLALHLAELTTDSAQKAAYLNRGIQAYGWVNANLLTKPGQGEFAGKLYWDKILASNGSIDTRYWSYNQGVMIGAGVLLARLDPANATQYIAQAVQTADAAIAHYNGVGWYSQPVIFNSLFFRNLLLLYAVDPQSYGRFRQAAQAFANQVWDDTKIHNKQKHLIKFEEWTGAHKLREQAAMVQLFACLAWSDAGKSLSNLA